jgi:4-hydroxybenzoate polyprenyltransferase
MIPPTPTPVLLSRMVALPHTVFSMPFALGAAAIAGARVRPPVMHYVWIVVAVASCRVAAMAFNRWADRAFDAANPRTAGRELPRRAVSPGAALAMTVSAAALFVVAAWRLGPLPLALAPIALIVCLGYSLAKRLARPARAGGVLAAVANALPHTMLGIALAGAPAGAWLAITGGFGAAPLVLSIAVAAWVAGFDLIYACQDEGFDRAAGLGSIPARWGAARALAVSAGLHVVTAAGLVAFGALLGLGVVYYAGVAAIAGTLVYEHRIVSADDLSRVNKAFFDLNGWVSLLFGVCAVVEALGWSPALPWGGGG